MNYIRANLKNIEKLYNDWNGNLYYKDTYLYKDWKFWLVDGFDLDDIKHGIINGLEVIWVEGSELDPFDMEELENWKELYI